MMRFDLRALSLAALVGLGVLLAPDGAEAGRRGWGPGVGAGLLGLGIGVAVGSALTGPGYYYPPPPPLYVAPPVYAPVAYGPAPWTPEWYGYCEARYASFDPSTGTFVGYDGYEHFCR